MGTIEDGVRSDLRKCKVPVGGALAQTAIKLAKLLDGDLEDKTAAGLARELRLTLNEIGAKPPEGADRVDKLASRTRDK